MKSYEFSACIEEGRLKVGLPVLREMREALNHWQRCPVTVTVERQYATRSLDANALYWVGFVNPLAEWTGNSPKWMHAYLKRRFLPKQRIEIVDRRTGQVVDECDLDQLTTTQLTEVEFSKYLDEITEFALGLGCHVGSNKAERVA